MAPAEIVEMVNEETISSIIKRIADIGSKLPSDVFVNQLGSPQ